VPLGGFGETALPGILISDVTRCITSVNIYEKYHSSALLTFIAILSGGAEASRRLART
jgi:hypothetical protein